MVIISPYLAIIILNLTGLNSLTKRHRTAEWIKINDIQQYAAHKRLTLDLKTHIDWQWRVGKIHFRQIG